MLNGAEAKKLCMTALLFLSLACVPPQALPTAPESAQNEDFFRDMPIPNEKIFPKVISVLMDLGYQVRVVNRELGHVSFSRAWNQSWGVGQVTPQSLEATLYFQAVGPAVTKARVLIQFQSPVLGRQIMDPAQGKALLEAIETSLLKPL